MFENKRKNVRGYAEFNSPLGYLCACLDERNSEKWHVYKMLRYNKYKFLGYAKTKALDCLAIYNSLIEEREKTSCK